MHSFENETGYDLWVSLSASFCSICIITALNGNDEINSWYKLVAYCILFSSYFFFVITNIATPTVNFICIYQISQVTITVQ